MSESDESKTTDRLESLISHSTALKKVKVLKNDTFEWLLGRIFMVYEPSVREISILMHDSFSRFKCGTDSLYIELCKLADKELNVGEAS